MTNKELIIQNFNNFIKETLVPNKLAVIIENNQAAGIPFEELKLVNIYISEEETDSVSPEEKFYNTIVLVFNIGENSFELTTDFYNGWGGLYPMENYTVQYENWENHLTSTDEEFVDYGLHNFINQYSFFDLIGSYNILAEFKNEYLKELSLKLSNIKVAIPNVESVNAVSFNECVLRFKGGHPLTVSIHEVESIIQSINNN